MAQGRATKWVTVHIKEPISLGRSGVTFVVWDKWHRTRRGTVVVSVGGIRWYSYKAKKARWLNWAKFEELVYAD
jgi:hypothetical protein